MLARAAVSSEAWDVLPSSVGVGKIWLLVVVVLKSHFLAGGSSVPRGCSQVLTIQPSHNMVASESAC